MVDESVEALLKKLHPRLHLTASTSLIEYRQFYSVRFWNNRKRSGTTPSSDERTEVVALGSVCTESAQRDRFFHIVELTLPYRITDASQLPIVPMPDFLRTGDPMDPDADLDTPCQTPVAYDVGPSLPHCTADAIT
jgi:hypothetical protein